MSDIKKFMNRLEEVYGVSGTDPEGKHSDYIHGDVRKPSNKGKGAQPGFVGEDELMEKEPEDELKNSEEETSDEEPEVEEDDPNSVNIEMIARLLFDQPVEMSLGKIAIKKMLNGDELNLKERNMIVSGFGTLLPALRDRVMYNKIRLFLKSGN